MKFISHSVADTLKLGRGIARQLKQGDIICLFGDLGSGKTVLARGIAEGLGVKAAEVISPTFVLLRELQGRLPFYHFDLYRMEKIKDILGLGYEEYFYGAGCTAVEWAGRLGRLLPKEYLKITLRASADKERRIELTALGSRYQELIKAL